MAKDWEVRLDETLATITTKSLTALLEPFELPFVLKFWLSALSAQQRENVSNALGQKGTDNKPGDKPKRDLRRAIILTKCLDRALQGANDGAPNEVANEVNAIAQTENLDNRLTTALTTAAGHLPAMMPRALENAWSRLLQDPLAFLKATILTIYGVPKGARPPVGARVAYKVYVDDKGLALTPLNTNKTFVQKDAWMIPAQNYMDVKDDDDVVSAEVAGNVALTSQFSGCCYCFSVSRDGANFRAAHIDPEQGKREDGREVTGPYVAKKLRDGGQAWFSNMFADGTYCAYGRINSGPPYPGPVDPRGTFGYADGAITIVAVKQGTWKVYAQSVNIVDKRILTAAQIHPR